MKSKRFRAGISRIKIPDHCSSEGDVIYNEILKNYYNNLTGYSYVYVGVYCPARKIFNV
jgi:hypothetical protein